jgi:hypothetical protein
MPGVSFQSRAEGVTQPAANKIKSLAYVRGADARSAKIERCNGVTRFFHVSVYKVEPSETILACNLFAKDCARVALCDEVVKDGPQMSLIFEPLTFSDIGEWLARTASGPDLSLIRPSGESQGVTPNSDPCEEMALCESSEVIRSHINNTPCIHFTVSDLTGFD